MSTIIASTYELIKKVGAGGGGIVYLANHLRLQKKVILKVDRRRLSTKTEQLRREVDILKELNHTYIPQVYDFFIEGETVITVISYIEGESLDKPLKRGEKFEQKQVIRWAKEILQALDYLHSPTHGDPPRGYIHSDIKPANIMLKPNGDISLIDFNIAFALGEEDAIGCSKGYSSPEHYGLDYSSGSSLEEEQKGDTETRLLTGLHNADKSGSGVKNGSGSAASGSSFKKRVSPDVRSDIYSVGATLYHLIAGVRPDMDAKAVKPLSKETYNPQLVDIIKKAMDPNPDLRYQTAEEMLRALSMLHHNDSRMIRFKKRNTIVCSILLSLTVLGILSSFTGLKRMQTAERWMRLTDDADTAFQNGDVQEALRKVMQIYNEQNRLLTGSAPVKARETLTGILGVYDLSDTFTLYRTLDLPSAPLSLALSADEKTIAVISSGELQIIETQSGEIRESVPAAKSALSEVHFITDHTLVYSGDEALTVYDTESCSIVWEGEKAIGIAVSADGSTIAAVDKDSTYACIYDAVSGEIINRIDFGGRKQSAAVNDLFVNPHNNLLVLDAAGQLLAVSFEDGSLEVFDTRSKESTAVMAILDDSSEYSHFEGGFYQEYLAFSASGREADESVFAVIDTKKQEQAGGFGSEGYYFSSADEQGIVVGIDNILVKLEPVSGEQEPLVDTSKRITKYAYKDPITVISSGNEVMFFGPQGIEMCSYVRKDRSDLLVCQGHTAVIGSSDSSTLLITRYAGHDDKEAAVYDPSYKHNEARLSSDGRALMLFSYDKFRICDTEGSVICDVEIPDADNVYDQQYIREDGNTFLKVIYNDGTTDRYNGLTGELIDRQSGSPPDLSLYVEYETDTLRIESPLHGTPKAYDKKTGKLIAELDENAYLTYVTEIGEYIVAQYTTTDNRFYGYLMDRQCHKLAYLPNVCDVYEETLLFDEPSGSIREEHIYELDELIDLAIKRLEEKPVNED